MSKWIEFAETERSLSGKTRTWEILGIGGCGPTLGQIKWFSRWRCYSFFPESNHVFEQQCLRDIADFCEAETKAHRIKR